MAARRGGEGDGVAAARAQGATAWRRAAQRAGTDRGCKSSGHLPHTVATAYGIGNNSNSVRANRCSQ